MTGAVAATGAPEAGVPALACVAVSKHYGELKAVSEVSFEVAPGARHAVIGPNGAGKSTLFSVIAGTLPATAGRVLVAGRDVTKSPEHRRAAFGVAKTFQHSSLFPGTSALENVAIAVQRERGVAWQMLRAAGRRRDVTDAARAGLERVGLGERAATPAGSLSHGERRQLEVAVALATRPRLLLLDEPTAGMSAAESGAFVALVRGLPAELTVLLIEHDLEVVFGLASRVTVMHVGTVLADGSPDDVRSDPAVQEAYLGTSAVEALFEDAP